ncbi:hypothetical protein LTR70_007041 [Exophiala xenobiotica]|uniref:Uncharacterized protein n=1 Tax=Lithohypha guttulata TaxID=1690604 RepID=A0ABR0K5F2_9EURO|nr:hypothetical protein LTR24_006641 [Lithohypha guttulata]KAK5314679.1 hypothetical protein LTR70_007041 [Exophiala xenobiotica]
MPPDVRFYKSKRWCHECQTHVEIKVQDCEEEAGPASMGLNILSALKFVIPAERAYTVETGNLYIRRHNGGKELVRKRTVKCDCKDTMCKKCKHGNDSRRGAEADLAREYAAKAERRRQLEAELARAEERELRERIGIRERRPYQFSTERKDSTPPPESAAEMRAERPCRRRMSSAIDEPSPYFYHAGHCKKYQQQRHQHNHRRPSHHHAHHENRRCGYAPRQPEYYVQEIEPPASCRRNGRRPSRIISNNVYHNDVPIFCSRIITGGRRKSSSGGCRRDSRHYSRYYPDVQFETREPEDYYY